MDGCNGEAARDHAEINIDIEDSNGSKSNISGEYVLAITMENPRRVGHSECDGVRDPAPPQEWVWRSQYVLMKLEN